MSAPRALELNPGKKRVFKILAHQDQKPQRNPVKARKGKTQLRAQTKFGPPLELKTTGEFPYATEIEIRRRVGLLDDHLLAQYPQIMDELVPWLSRKAESSGEVTYDELEDFLVDALHLPPGRVDVASDIIEALANENILFEGKHAMHLAGPGVGKPPPFTNADAAARWALINVGADPNRADDLIRHLDEMPLDENGEIEESDLSDFLEDHLFANVDVGEFKPEDMQALVDNLVKSNLILNGCGGRGKFRYEAHIAGRSHPYVVSHLKRVLVSARQKGKDKWYLKALETQISDLERSVGRGGHFDAPPERGPAPLYVSVSRSRQGRYKARPVQDLVPGDVVLEMGPVPQYGAEVVSVVPKGDWYTVTVKDGAGKLFTKRAKKNKAVAIERDAPVPVFKPKYHPAERMKIDDPMLLQVMAFFEGQEWVNKQHRFPNCPKCVFGNKTAWEVLQSLGSKGKGITLAMLLEGAGRIEGAKHTGHWYEIDDQGYVNIESDTATDADVKALKEVGIESV